MLTAEKRDEAMRWAKRRSFYSRWEDVVPASEFRVAVRALREFEAEIERLELEVAFLRPTRWRLVVWWPWRRLRLAVRVRRGFAA